MEKARWMNAAGLNQGTAGNISARLGDEHADHAERRALRGHAADDDRGDAGRRRIRRLARASCRPPRSGGSTSTSCGRGPTCSGVVHAHPTFATALSVARRDIPACHYMIAAFGGNDIRCADYATQASEALSKNAVKALEGRNGCLLANHGMIAAGRDLDHAMWLAVELEAIAKHYFYALLIGGPVLLSDAEIEEARASMTGYGLRPKA